MNDYTVGCIADLISGNKTKKLKKVDKNKDVSKKQSNNDAKCELEKNKSMNISNKGKKRKFLESVTPDISKKKIKKDDNSTRETVSEEPNDQFKVKKESKNVKNVIGNKQAVNISGKDNKKSKYKLDLSDIVSETKKFQLKKVKSKTKKKLGNLSGVKKTQDDSLQEEKSSEDSEKMIKLKAKKVGQKQKVKPEKKLYTVFTENTIFVGNLPLTYDKQKVCKVFSKYGEIDSARIRCVPIANINMKKKVASIKKEFNPKRNSLVAYVRYKTKESAMEALKADGMVLDQHHIRVDLAESNKQKDMKKAVFVGGLPFNAEDDDLWEFFKNCGKINSVRVIRDSQTSMGKGFGYVNFDSTSSVELALQMNGQELKKRVINIKRCTNKMKKNKVTLSRRKTAEMTGQLLSKKNKAKKFKADNKKSKTESKSQLGSNEFQGRKANEKKKRKKKPSKDVLRKRKISRVLQSAYDSIKSVQKK